MANMTLLNASDFLDESLPLEQESQGVPRPAEQTTLSGLSDRLEAEQGQRTSASDNLPDELNFAGMKTGIPLTKKAAAFLVGMGDGLQDTIKGVSQIMGNAAIQSDLQAEKNMMKDLFNDPRYGGTARTGQIAGFFADPMGVIIPVAKGKNLYDVLKVGAATGTAFGGLGYVDEEAGQTRAGNALIGTVTGGVLSPALFGVSRGMKGVGGALQERAATGLLKTYRKEVNKFIANGANPQQATSYAMQKMGWTTRDKIGLIQASGKEFKIDFDDFVTGRVSGKGKPIFNESLAKKNVAAMDNRLITNAVGILERSSLGRDIVKAGTSFGKSLNNVITPISTRMAQIDSDLSRKLVIMEARIKHGQQKMHTKALDFNQKLRKIGTEESKLIDINLANGNLSKAREIFRKSTGDTKAFDDVMGVLDDMWKQARSAGYDLKKIEGYFPRRVRDLEKLAQVQDRNLDEITKTFVQRMRRDPTDRELDRLVRNIQNPTEGARFQTGGSLKKRSRANLTPEEAAHYHETEPTLTSYINDMVTDIERAKFLASVGAKRPKKGWSLDGTDLNGEEDVFGNVLWKRQQQGRYGAGEVEELAGLLRSRFTKGEMSPNDAIQAFKNSTYIATLGNFKSALTQLGDLAFSAHRNGIVNTSLALMERIPRLRRVVRNSHKRVTKEQLGLEEAIQEFAGDRNGKKALDWILTKTGFKAMDRLGKETFVNAHFRKVRKGLNGKNAAVEKSALRQKWNPVFGNETEQMIRDLQKGHLSDNVGLYLFNSLSEVQPIALSEMPRAYLDNPNGRIFYMLRSFTIKQLDLMRRDIVNSMARGDSVTAFKNLSSLGTMFVLANGSADTLKDFMTGKEINMEDTLVDNIWKLMGLNRYTGSRITSGTPAVAVVDMLAPPFSVYDRIIRSPASSQKLWEASPFNGLQIFDQMVNDGELTRTDSDNHFQDLGKFHDSIDTE